MQRRPGSTARQFVPTPGLQYKLIYLARRNPALTADEFPAAWRSHAQLAGSFATSLGKHFLSSRQCVKRPLENLPEAFRNEYDGSTILGMKSWDDLLAARYHPHSLDELQKDEERVFAGAVDDWTMAVEETAIVDGEPGDHVLLAFLAPARDAGDDFAGRSLALARDMAQAAPAATRIVWNRVVDPASAYRFAAVTECWFDSFDAAARAAADPQLVAALGQHGIADRDASVRLFACINPGRPLGTSDRPSTMDRNASHDGGGS
ncbi:EthD domain-containing protein [Novosphingobium pentaromativorans]|nr:EthD domain-containing protein [Novosphingobium pentaromativorans]